MGWMYNLLGVNLIEWVYICLNKSNYRGVIILSLWWVRFFVEGFYGYFCVVVII